MPTSSKWLGHFRLVSTAGKKRLRSGRRYDVYRDPISDILYALDLNDHGAMKWKYEAKPSAIAQGVACCDFVTRRGLLERQDYF